MQLLRAVLAAALGSAGLLALTSCGGEAGGSGAPRVGFVTNCVVDFWNIGKAGAQAAGDELGVDVEVMMPAGGDLEEQKQILETMLARGFDGIAVSPIDPRNQTDYLDHVASRTRLVTHDSDAPESARLAYVGMDNYQAGRLAGELVQRALPDGGEVMLFIGNLSQDNAVRRRQGVIDQLLGRDADPTRFDEPGVALRGNGYAILGTLTDNIDNSTAKANAEDALNRNPGLDAMVGLFAHNPPMCLAALRGAGKLGEVAVIGFDESDDTLQGIREGHVVGTVVQDPYRYGYESVRLLAALVRGEPAAVPEDGFVDVPARTITADNVDAFVADLRAKLAAAAGG